MLALGAKEWPKEHQAICVWQVLQSMATDVFSLAVVVHFLREILSTPPPPRLRKHCRQTEPTSSPSPFLGEGNDLQ